MATLIVFLPTDLPQESSQLEYLLTPDGRGVTVHSSAALALLPAAPGAEVVAVVPVQALSWHQVQLPRGLLGRGLGADRAQPRLRSVLEGLLEEHVLDEPSQLHFALAPDAAETHGGAVAVAACDRAWLQAWMHALERQQRPAARIVPEFAPLATIDAIHVIGPESAPRVVFASPNHSPSAKDAGASLSVLPLTADAALLADAPSGKSVFAEPALAALAERHFKRAVALSSRADRALQAIASTWDLAQFDLASSSGLRNWRRLARLAKDGLRAPQWRAARWAAAALVVANLVGLNAWAWSQRASLEAKRQAVREVLTSTFPAVKVVLDAPVQMAREVQRQRLASGAVSEGDLEVLLAAYADLADSWPELAAKKPAGMDYGNGELRVKGLDLGKVNLADINGRARAHPVQLRIEGESLVLFAASAP